MIGIYKITNILNNKVYIGQSIDIKNRWIQHIYEAKNKRKNGKLYPAMEEDGIDNFIFEVIEECNLDSSVLDAKERYWINYYDSFNNGYNSTKGGQGENSWIFDPILIRQLWDDGYSVKEITEIVGCGHTLVQYRLKGYHDYNATTSHSRGAIRAIKQGKIKVGEKYNFSENQKIYFSDVIEIHQYSIDGKYIASYPSITSACRAIGKTYAGCETNISRALHKDNNQNLAYGYQWSKEKLDKLPAVPQHLGKMVQCIETQQIFPSVREAANWCGLKSSSPIKDYLAGRGSYKSAGKHPETKEKLHWKYIV